MARGNGADDVPPGKLGVSRELLPPSVVVADWFVTAAGVEDRLGMALELRGAEVGMAAGEEGEMTGRGCSVEDSLSVDMLVVELTGAADAVDAIEADPPIESTELVLTGLAADVFPNVKLDSTVPVGALLDSQETPFGLSLRGVDDATDSLEAGAPYVTELAAVVLWTVDSPSDGTLVELTGELEDGKEVETLQPLFVEDTGTLDTKYDVGADGSSELVMGVFGPVELVGEMADDFEEVADIPAVTEIEIGIEGAVFEMAELVE